MNRIGQSSVRKPLAWLTVLYIMGVVSVYVIFNEDIPDRIANILVWLISIPCAVVGSSSYEAVRTPQRDGPEKGGPEDG